MSESIAATLNRPGRGKRQHVVEEKLFDSLYLRVTYWMLAR